MITRRLRLGPDSLVIEVASNDGSGIPVRHRLHNLEAGQRRVEDLHVVAQPNPAVAASAT
jgi:hypothetical protein